MPTTAAATFIDPGQNLPPCIMADLPGLWRRTVLDIQASFSPSTELDASLPHRLRGAWGHSLIEAAQRSDDAERARAAFFDDHGTWRAGAQLPKPFVIEADQAAGHTSLRLILFGVAGRWRDIAFDGFVRCLESGIAVTSESGAARHPASIIKADWRRLEQVDVPIAGRSIRLSFRTPLRLGPRHTLGLRYADLIVSLAERAAGLARWQGFSVEPQLGVWRDIAKRIEFRDEGLVPEIWSRRSGAQQGRVIPMAGLRGHLDIIRPPELIMPLLALGQTMHVGGGAALGLGRYDLL